MTNYITEVNKTIVENLCLSKYAMLINTAFDDEVLQIAYNMTVNRKERVPCVYNFFINLCRTVSERMKREPNYQQMYILVKAAGFNPGDNVYAYDDESQPYKKGRDPEYVNPIRERIYQGRPGFAQEMQDILKPRIEEAKQHEATRKPYDQR
jgi:hypothetical protein